jgi:hypothetical protein
MSEYFSVDTDFDIGECRLHIKPSAYDSTLVEWTPTRISCFRSGSLSESACVSIEPGSDRIKLIISADQKYVAVVCESQWYEDLYLYEVGNLRRIASFEGSNGVDGASDGQFFGSIFITFPTFSYEGGCGGLRSVDLTNGVVVQLLPVALFQDMHCWLQPADSQSTSSSNGRVILSSPFGLLGWKYDRGTGKLFLDYAAGTFVISGLFRKSSQCEYAFVSCDDFTPAI